MKGRERRKLNRDEQLAVARVNAVARELIGRTIQEALEPVITGTLKAVSIVTKGMEAKAALAGIDGDQLALNAFRELVAGLQFRLLDAVFKSHKGDRKIFYQVLGEVCDRLSDTAEFCTNDVCKACNGTGMLAPEQKCPACKGATRVPGTGDRVGVKVEVGFAEGAPGAPRNPKKGDSLYTPKGL